ncbi:MAG: SLBB domain-containing protein [Geopsychrobacter sp.]|nr:SLBB domain-containing protein [Geopsychrobacter sp.]
MRKIFSSGLFLLVLLQALTAFSGTLSYRIGEGDLLLIKVYDMEDLTTTVRVDADGQIGFPLIGQVNVDDLTIQQVRDRISAELADGYLVNPQVSVLVQEYRSNKIVIIGEVVRPGLYELQGEMSLLELISRAGGLAPDAGTLVTIRHAKSAAGISEEVVDLADLMGKQSANVDIVLANNDNVFVEKAGFVYVTGEVGKPDAYKLKDGTSVIMAITMAGGFSKLASKNKVKLVRIVDGKEQTFKRVPMNQIVLPDDVIVVPESFF